MVGDAVAPALIDRISVGEAVAVNITSPDEAVPKEKKNPIRQIIPVLIR